MPSDDLKHYATSSIDFYDLLGISFETSQRDIDRAWRRTALKYHPDKVGADPTAKEKFHLAQIGYDLLSDPSTKVLYDNARAAREQRRRHNELFDGKRKKMKEDLEKREGGMKRGREEDEGDEEKLEREVRKLAEDGKRRRVEREEALRKEIWEEERLRQEEEVGGDGSNGVETAAECPNGVAEIDRTVKILWPREGLGKSLSRDRLFELFSTFGRIESAFMLKDKKRRVGEDREKKVFATGVVVYASVVGAHAAVEDIQKRKGAEWDTIESVFWAANKEPEFMNGGSLPRTSPPASSPSTPNQNGGSTDFSKFLNKNSGASSPSRLSQRNGDGLRKVPSFASFSSASSSTPRGSPFGKGLGPGSPSLEEITMIRLKNAEKKRLVAEIRKQDEEVMVAGEP